MSENILGEINSQIIAAVSILYVNPGLKKAEFGNVTAYWIVPGVSFRIDVKVS